MPDVQKFPTWNAAQSAEALQAVYLWAVQNTEAQIGWYKRNTGSKRRGSQIIRAGAIFFAALGALCPLLDAAGFMPALATLFGKSWSGNHALAQWGYVFFAVAAAIVGFDRYFGLSTCWMRFIVTQMALEKTLKEFQYDWLILQAQQAEHTVTLLQKARDFTSQTESLVKQETDAWVLEFQNNLAQLEKVLKAEAEQRKSGSIKITVTNAADFERVSIRLNDTPRKELVGTTEGLLEAVPPGQHEVTVIGKKGTKEYKAARVVDVQPNTATAVELTIKI